MENELKCPLCKQTKHMRWAKSLYGHVVCKKCYSGFAERRQLAYIIDNVCCAVFGVLILIVFAIILYSQGASPSAMEGVVYGIEILIIIYFPFKDSFWGASPGKALCGIKVIDKTSGQPTGIVASFKRNLPLFIPFLPLIVAIQLNQGHRIGDGWANTKVIWKKYADHPIFLPLQAKEDYST